MAEGEGEGPVQDAVPSAGREAPGGGERVLRAKYRDYCSARVADVLLTLSPDEIYALAESEARKADQVAPASYDDAVRFATRRLRDQLALPDFPAWAEEYRSHPERFDPLLIGLWESEAG